MVGEEIYVKLLRNFLDSCSGWKGIFMNDSDFERIYGRIINLSYKFHSNIYNKQIGCGKIPGLPERILKLESKLMKEKIKRDSVFCREN